MLIGAHSVIYSKKAQADRKFLWDVLKLPHIDVGDGWLIFGLPPSEVAVHPANTNGPQELYFMVNNIETFVHQMREHRVACDPIQNQGWGLLTHLTLPGGGRIGVYQPRHKRPGSMRNESTAANRRQAFSRTALGRPIQKRKSKGRDL